MPRRRLTLALRLLAACGLSLALVGLALLGLHLTPVPTAEADGPPHGRAPVPYQSLNKRPAMGSPGVSQAPPAVAPAQERQAPEQTGGVISERVLANGTPVAGAQLVLRSYVRGQTESSVLTTTTTITGYYAFANPPSTPTGFTYYVRYGPQYDNLDYVSVWYGPDLPPYVAGTRASGGDLNIASVPAISPADNTTVTLPVTFRWTRRATTTDSYSFFLGGWSETNYTDTVESGPLGYVGEYTVTSFPRLQFGEPYGWVLEIRDTGANNSYGYTWPNIVYFRCTLCAGVIVVRAYIDFGCDNFFNRGTDYPLFGTTVTATLPDGTRRTGVVDENGNAVISGVNLSPNDSVTLTVDDPPPPPTWVQQSNYGLAACSAAPTTVSTPTTRFTLFGVTFVDFRFGLVRR